MVLAPGPTPSSATGMLTLPPKPVRAPAMPTRAVKTEVATLPAAAPLPSLAMVIMNGPTPRRQHRSNLRSVRSGLLIISNGRLADGRLRLSV